jgi:hypothetical protein
MTEDFAQSLIDLRRVALAAYVTAEFRFDHAECRFGV